MMEKTDGIFLKKSVRTWSMAVLKSVKVAYGMCFI